jgi:oxalate decarboxylase
LRIKNTSTASNRHRTNLAELLSHLSWYGKDTMKDINSKYRFNRRSVLGATAAALSAGALGSVRGLAQTREQVASGEGNHSASNPGPKNNVLQGLNPDSYLPPATDRGVIEPIWYSFDLVHRRIQDGGWTSQVTSKEFPSSQDIAGVTMRLTAGSYRELHWHSANEWAYMLYGNARVTVFEPNGKIFIGDVSEGDLWFFPTAHPHSIQGLGPDGCEFLLAFDQGNFSEYNTFLLTGYLAHTPSKVLSQNFNIPEAELSVLPESGLYIFPGTVPGPLEDDRKAVGGPAVASMLDYTFKMKSMKPSVETAGGSLRIVDSNNFPASKSIAAGLFNMKPGALRELHWHPVSEWQYYIGGNARMTVFASAGEAHTMDYKANDVGLAPAIAGHYIQNTGNDDLAFLALFKSSEFVEFSLDQWLRRIPVQMTEQHLRLSPTAIARIPDQSMNIFPR